MEIKMSADEFVSKLTSTLKTAGKTADVISLIRSAGKKEIRLKEYGVTSPPNARCGFCGGSGKKTEMARVSRGEGKNHWVHDSCVLDEINKRKEE